MKSKFLFTLGFLLICFNALAANVERITTDPVLMAAVKAVELKYHVQCKMPKGSNIQWRCVMGGACGYELEVSCSEQKTIANPAKSIRLIVDGYDTGTTNSVLNIRFDNSTE